MALQGKFEALTKELITHVLGFEEGEENFLRSEQFVLSNLLYHHCLAVNSHNVRRSIDGLALKFTIHGQQIRAQKLNELTSRFLASPLFKDHYETDLEWSLLSLMLHLSNSPTQVPLTSAEQSILMTKNASPSSSQDLREEQIDWAAYLLKGEPEFVVGPEDPLSDWSDHEDDGAIIEADASEQEYSEREKTTESDASLEEYSQEIQVIPRIVNQDVKLVEQSHRAKSWLSGNTHLQYWRGKCYQHETLSSHLAANFAKVFEDARGGERSQRISEWAVMREVLWLLMHPVSSHIFYQNEEGDFVLRNKITLPSLTLGSSSSILKQMCTPLKQLSELDSFVLHCKCPEEDPPTPVTLLAYVAGLRLWRSRFLEHLSMLESVVKKQEETSTLSWLENELKNWFRVLSTIYTVHHATFCVATDVCPRNVALRLIGSLCEGVEGCGDGNARCVLLRLLLHTLRHYFSIMHNWLFLGTLVDLGEEFIIQRNEAINVTDEMYWKEAFAISHQLGYQDIAVKDPMKTGVKILLPIALALSSIGKSQELFSALQVKLSHDDPNALTHSSLTDEGEEEAEKTLEELLVDHIISVINAGKPNELQEEDSVNEITSSTEDSTKDENGGGKIKPPCKTEVNEVAKLDIQDKDATHIQNILSLSDYLLVMDCSDGEEEDERGGSCSSHQMDYLARKIEEITDVPRVISVLSFLSSSLRPLISRKQRELDTQLTQLLIRDYKLDYHCRAVRSILLMEAGDIMHEFYLHLFTKLDCGEAVESISLSLHLEYCIARLYPDLAKLFSVSVEPRGDDEEELKENQETEDMGDKLTEKCRKDATVEQLSALGLPYISIYYQAPWPMNLLLTEEIMNKFNMLFRFSLSLKRATTGLERLKFKDMASWSALVAQTPSVKEEEKEESDSPLQSRLHRLQLLRLWLLSFARELHNYFANVVFLPYHQSFEELVNSKPSFNTIVTNHEILLNKVLSLCLMGNKSKVSPLQVVLNKVFWLTQQLSHLWMRDIGRVTSEELTSLECQYSKIHRYLVTLLTHVTSTRFLPHLEGMTRTLANTMPLLTYQI